MLKFGLIGHPISHSQSPALFAEAFGGKYPYELIQTPDFEEAWSRFLSDYKAINVTAPFKEQALCRADIITEECRLVGATNLCVKTSGGIKAYNSDYRGVRKILAGKGFGRGDVALVAGFGGAGKAAAQACRGLGLDTIICNRTTSKDKKLRPLDELSVLAAVADVIVYTLPVAVPGIDAFGGKTVLEANYRDPVLGSLPCDYISGTVWLRAQADEGYALMFEE